MVKKNSYSRNRRQKRRSQKLYKMKGCSKRSQLYSGGAPANFYPSSVNESTSSMGQSSIAYNNAINIKGGKTKCNKKKRNNCTMNYIKKYKKYIKHKQHKKNTMKGGTLSNLFGQDVINLGRQASFGLGSAYNGITGYTSPVNPLPWKDQMPNAMNINTIKALSV